ncbi:uncharacterized protein EV420DRAFT_1480735 [Desarmillaria tabescens]|uniref:Uncharacterized protein n=1 Tax=Armillaria tabescens TaxID=1929756 RepID=A0AA39N3W9_ARMTA|nr:uncharacterized protein EV420DRAFT_1480735 [Desarmillaria tabescens]KAK0457261.1 hypothetical protein EV420DRAFT_1480735 [Desarmillaria tabescens]
MDIELIKGTGCFGSGISGVVLIAISSKQESGQWTLPHSWIVYETPVGATRLDMSFTGAGLVKRNGRQGNGKHRRIPVEIPTTKSSSLLPLVFSSNFLNHTTPMWKVDGLLGRRTSFVIKRTVSYGVKSWPAVSPLALPSLWCLIEIESLRIIDEDDSLQDPHLVKKVILIIGYWGSSTETITVGAIRHDTTYTVGLRVQTSDTEDSDWIGTWIHAAQQLRGMLMDCFQCSYEGKSSPFAVLEAAIFVGSSNLGLSCHTDGLIPADSSMAIIGAGGTFTLYSTQVANVVLSNGGARDVQMITSPIPSTSTFRMIHFECY